MLFSIYAQKILTTVEFNVNWSAFTNKTSGKIYRKVCGLLKFLKNNINVLLVNSVIRFSVCVYVRMKEEVLENLDYY